MTFEELYKAAQGRFSKGDRPGCERLCLQAIALAPDHAGILNLLGLCALQGRPGEAVVYFSRAVQSSPGLLSLRFNLVLAYQGERRISEAIQAVQEAIRLDPSVAALHGKLGHLLLIAGQPEDAEPALRAALKLEPSSIPARVNLATTLTDLSRFSEAEQIARDLLARAPRKATPLRLIGRILQIQGKTEEAAEIFQRCLSIHPDDPETIHSYLYSRRSTEKDIALLHRVDALITAGRLPDSGKCLLSYALGKGLDDLGDYRNAAAAFHRASALALQAIPPYDWDAERRRNDLRMAPVTATGSLPSARPIFIVGMIRSGTTLVEQILSRHSGVAAGGENGFWLKHEAEIPPDLTPLISGYLVWLDKVSATSARVTDKMPLNYQVLGLIHRAFPRAKIVHLRRDRRDTCLSVYVTPYRVSPPFGHDLENIRFAYEEYERLMAHWRSVLPAQTMLEIDYETLVAEPGPVVRRLIEFLGLEWEEGLLDSGVSGGSASTPSVWQARQPIYKSSVGRSKLYEPYISI